MTSLPEIGALVGDPGRANILAALLDGRALTASELAGAAGVAAPTASEHLAKLVAGGLIDVARQGRHRYFRLASGDVARMLEGMMVVAAAREAAPPRRRATPRVRPALRDARTCYDHLAGRLGVGIADAMMARGLIVLGDEAGEVTAAGHRWLAALGINVGTARSPRLFCRPCLDWSERRPHLAGRLGAAICTRCVALGWIRREPGGRAVIVTSLGYVGFAEMLGLSLRDFPSRLARE